MMPTNVPSQGISFLENHDFMDELHFMKVHLFIQESWFDLFLPRLLCRADCAVDVFQNPTGTMTEATYPPDPKNNAPCEKGMYSPNALPICKVRKLWTKPRLSLPSIVWRFARLQWSCTL